MKMTRARQVEAWNHTADLQATLANLHRTEAGGKIWKRADFHPFIESPKLPRSNDPLDIM